MPPEYRPEHDVLSIRRHRMGVRTGAPVTHSGHALCWMDRGTSDVELNHRSRAEGGCFVIVPAGVPHRILDHSPDAACWGVGFCAGCLGLSPDDALMLPFRRVRMGAPPVVRVPAERVAWVDQLHAELAAACAESSPGAVPAQRALLVLILRELCRAARLPDAALSSTRVGRALDWISAHALEPISLRDVAAAVHCSPSHLANQVKDATGATVGDWIRATRVASAASWLLHSDASVEEVAGRVGFGDTTHFIRQFRKVHGQTPAAWRASMRVAG